MGRFVNPDISAFQVALNSEIYVDKTGLIEYTNSILGSSQKYICCSRPRRFGKSTDANMLAAYYSCGCKSRSIFAGLDIGKRRSYPEHLNKYVVVHFDVQWCAGQAEKPDDCVYYMEKLIIDEIKSEYPEHVRKENKKISDALLSLYNGTGRKTILIIDEWDALIRQEGLSKKVKEEYLHFLENLFLGEGSDAYLSLGYMTGILPVERTNMKHTLKKFAVFSMMNANELAPYMGFTEEEVKKLCMKHKRNFNDVRRWCGGYLLGDRQMFSPISVVNVMIWGKYHNYWTQTGSYEVLTLLFDKGADWANRDIGTLLSDVPIKMGDTKTYVDSKDQYSKEDIYTILVDLGYLTYNQRDNSVQIPNDDVRTDFLCIAKQRNCLHFA